MRLYGAKRSIRRSRSPSGRRESPSARSLRILRASPSGVRSASTGSRKRFARCAARRRPARCRSPICSSSTGEKLTTAAARGSRLQVHRHVDVVLDGVQIGPRQHVFVRDQVLVLRLVHVPAQHHSQRLGRAHPSRISQHVGRDEHDALLGDMEAACIGCSDRRRCCMPSGISQPSSRIALTDHAALPDVDIRQDHGALDLAALLRRARRRTAATGSPSAPEMIAPPETIEFTAMPRRPSSSSTNLAGGCCSW